MTLIPQSMLNRLSAAYRAVASPSVLHRLERTVIRLSMLGLALHLLLVALARAQVLPPSLTAALGTSFLAALYTPFSFILFFEVLQLVLTLPASMTVSLGKQFEIVSLIILRGVFKDVAKFDALASIGRQQDALTDILWNMGGGVGMFALVAAFYHVSLRSPRPTVVRPLGTLPARVANFVAHKRTLAMMLAALLFILAAGHLGAWCLDRYEVLVLGHTSVLDVDRIFYLDLFTVMVFVDVAVLLLSMELDSAYPMVFRNAGYVIATILLRFSLSLDTPWAVALALLAVLFGVVVAGTHRYWQWLLDTQLEEQPSPVAFETDTGSHPPITAPEPHEHTH
ncbi:MAG TPA: hypothetical protein DFR83_12660 [Deltaproteobacteria bacterium]|nr:hypothetical protein [Deltaproteobacteria bacterium]